MQPIPQSNCCNANTFERKAGVYYCCKCKRKCLMHSPDGSTRTWVGKNKLPKKPVVWVTVICDRPCEVKVNIVSGKREKFPIKWKA